MSVERFKVTKVYKNSGRRVTIETGLTELEAQKMVQEDQKTNPNSLKSMLIYTKQ
jgi:hypothetical protein